MRWCRWRLRWRRWRSSPLGCRSRRRSGLARRYPGIRRRWWWRRWWCSPRGGRRGRRQRCRGPWWLHRGALLERRYTRRLSLHSVIRRLAVDGAPGGYHHLTRLHGYLCRVGIFALDRFLGLCHFPATTWAWHRHTAGTCRDKPRRVLIKVVTRDIRGADRESTTGEPILNLRARPSLSYQLSAGADGLPDLLIRQRNTDGELRLCPDGRVAARQSNHSRAVLFSFYLARVIERREIGVPLTAGRQVPHILRPRNGGGRWQRSSRRCWRPHKAGLRLLGSRATRWLRGCLHGLPRLPTTRDAKHTRPEWRVNEPGPEAGIVHHPLTVHHVIEEAAAADRPEGGQPPDSHSQALLNDVAHHMPPSLFDPRSPPV